MKILVIVWLAAISAALAGLGLRDIEPTEAAPAPLPASATFDRITVHRIDLVEPDGKPRLIMSNSDQYPGAFFEGKEYPHPGRRKLGGLLFFNDEGTEAGGVGYYAKRENGKLQAGALMTMDQYNQNETASLSYEDDNGARSAGLFVFNDHPKVGLGAVIKTNAEMVAAKSDAERAQLKAKLTKLLETDVGKLNRRVFVGRDEGVAEVVLADDSGTPRIVMQVDAKGEPTIQFRDAAGKTVKTLEGK